MSTVSSTLDARLENLRRALGPQEIDALFVTDIVNLGYLTGFTGSTAVALITPSEAILITDGRYTLRARQESPHFSLLETVGSGGYSEKTQEMLTAHPEIGRLGFEAGHMTVAQAQRLQLQQPSVTWVPTEGVVEALRVIKDAGEVDAIRRAIVIAETAWQAITPLLRPGVAEQEIALEMEFAMRRAGADDRAFATIVASGAQGARPHHTPNERPLVDGDLVTIDWGASVDGYNSDITRTVGIGHLSTEQQQTYEIVLEAQRRAIAAIAPEKTGKAIDSVARDYFASHGMAEAFTHGLGHSLGRQVHDGPGLSQRSENFVLKPGMVLTVEPGLYRENWGGLRIEEDVLVTETGCEILTHLPNALEVY